MPSKLDRELGLLKEARVSISSLESKNASLAKTAQEEKQKAEQAESKIAIYKKVIDLVASGQIDPDDAHQKAADFVADPVTLDLFLTVLKTGGAGSGMIGRPVESRPAVPLNEVDSFLVDFAEQSGS